MAASSQSVGDRLLPERLRDGSLDLHQLLAQRAEITRATVLVEPPLPSQMGFTGGVAQASGSQSLAISAVWRAVMIYADTAAALGYDAYRNGREVSPAPRVVRQPDASMSRARWVRRVVVDLLVQGNAYALKGQLDANGYPLALIHVPAAWVTPITYGTWGMVEQWEIMGTRYGLDEVVHVPWIEVAGRTTGIGPVEAARRSLDLAYWQDVRAVQLNRDDYGVPLALETERQLTSTQAQELQDQWVDARVRNGRKPAVLHSGITAKRDMGFSPEDMEFLASRDHSLQDVGRFMGVPSSMLDVGVKGSSITYSNRLDDVQSFITFSLSGVVDRICELFSSDQVTTSRTEVRADYGRLLQAAPKDQADIFAVMFDRGVISVEEWRQAIDLDPEVTGTTIHDQASEVVAPVPDGSGQPLAEGLTQ